MISFDVKPLEAVNEIRFGTDREAVRKRFGNKYEEIKKSPYSVNTMDAYKDFHVYFSADNLFEAIEIFGAVRLTIDGKTIFPGKVSTLKSIIDDLKDDDDYLFSTKYSVGVTVDVDDNDKIEGILFGVKGYYL